MADQGGTMTAAFQIGADTPYLPDARVTKDFLGGLQMAVADTECAQALLDLATSIVPTGIDVSSRDIKVEHVSGDSKSWLSSPPEFPCSSAEWDSEKHAPTKIGPELKGKRSKQIRVGYHSKSPPSSCSRTNLKRDSECSSIAEELVSGVEGQGKKSKSKKKKRLTSGETLRYELVKRIRLDHTYAWVGSERRPSQDEGIIPGLQDVNAFKRYCESIKLGKFEDSGLEYGDESPTLHGPDEDEEDETYDEHGEESEVDEADNKLPASPAVGNLLDKLTGKCSPKHPVDSKIYSLAHQGNSEKIKQEHDPFEFQEGDDDVEVVPRLIHKKLSPTGQRHSQKQSLTAGSSKNSADMLDDRFRNFRLLIQCLEKGEEEEAGLSDDSGNEDDDDDDDDEDDRSDGEVLVVDGGSLVAAAFQCQCCNKTFSKKRYMTKHVRRMHPGTSLSERNEVVVVCPNCGRMISKKNFKHHSEVCKAHAKKSKKQLEMDLANCQFCGIRMRRHMLVKHLAQEHCVDNVDKETSPEGMSDDSDSWDSSDETYAEYPQAKKKLLCGECNAVIQRWEVRQHFAEKHVLRPPNHRQVACQLCGTELPKTQLVKHLAEMHCVEEISDKSLPSKQTPKPHDLETKLESPQRPKPSCRHSMLARYINENNPNGSNVDHQPAAESSVSQDLETCQTCVGFLTGSSSQTPAKEVASGTAKLGVVKNFKVVTSPPKKKPVELETPNTGSAGNCIQCSPKTPVMKGVSLSEKPVKNTESGTSISAAAPRIQVLSAVSKAGSPPAVVKVISGTAGTAVGNRTIVRLVADKSKIGSTDKVARVTKPVYIPAKSSAAGTEKPIVPYFKPVGNSTASQVKSVSAPGTVKKMDNVSQSQGTIKTVTIYKGKNNKVHSIGGPPSPRIYTQYAGREKSPLMISVMPHVPRSSGSGASQSYKSGSLLRGSSGKV